MKKLVLFAALSLFAIGCGNDCVDTCEGTKECPDASDAIKAFDCTAFCDAIEDEAEIAGCSSEFDEAYSCYVDQDVCDFEGTNAACDAQRDVLVACNPPPQS